MTKYREVFNHLQDFDPVEDQAEGGEEELEIPDSDEDKEVVDIEEEEAKETTEEKEQSNPADQA